MKPFERRLPSLNALAVAVAFAAVAIILMPLAFCDKAARAQTCNPACDGHINCCGWYNGRASCIPCSMVTPTPTPTPTPPVGPTPTPTPTPPSSGTPTPTPARARLPVRYYGDPTKITWDSKGRLLYDGKLVFMEVTDMQNNVIFTTNQVKE